MIPDLDTYDWREVFGYAGESNVYNTGTPERSHADEKTCMAPFTREDVALILAKSEGENEGPPWIIAGKLNDGRWFFVEAGCDYTGWDCRSSGSSWVASSVDDLIRYCITPEHRKRLGLTLAVDIPPPVTEAHLKELDGTLRALLKETQYKQKVFPDALDVLKPREVLLERMIAETQHIYSERSKK